MNTLLPDTMATLSVHVATYNKTLCRINTLRQHRSQVEGLDAVCPLLKSTAVWAATEHTAAGIAPWSEIVHTGCFLAAMAETVPRAKSLPSRLE